MSVMYVTKETLEQMKAELHKMKTVERPAASRAIAEAREKGDLKENAEYDAAKEAQGLLEARISRMETELANARILDASEIDTSKVSILTKVTITNKATKKSMTYQIVSEKEADLKLQKISVTSYSHHLKTKTHPLCIQYQHKKQQLQMTYQLLLYYYFENQNQSCY